MDIPAHGDAQASAGAPARLLGQLHGDLLEGDHIVLADGARLLRAEDAVKIHPLQGDERGGGMSPFDVAFATREVAANVRSRMDTCHELFRWTLASSVEADHTRNEL
jgi:hypothetical protein